MLHLCMCILDFPDAQYLTKYWVHMPAATLNYPALEIKGAGCICLLNADTTALQNENGSALCVLN